MLDSEVKDSTRDALPHGSLRTRLSLKSSEQDVPELPSVRQLLLLLDKTFKTLRTYGPHNPVAQRFFQQFYADLTTHLNGHDTLLFLVHRSELYYKGHVVYQSSSPTENLAFKLHMDGIRELSFHKGLSQSDATFFLEALWGGGDQESADEDIVTRLWGKNLTNISFMTAEEIIKSSDFVDVLTPQEAQALDAPVSNLPQMKSAEASRKAHDEGTGTGTGSGTGVGTGTQGQSTVVSYEISEEELRKLAQEIEAESSRDNITYLLDMLTAVLASEQSAVLLTKLLDLFSETIDALTRQGNWTVLNTIVSLLQESQDLCPNLADEHKRQLSTIFGTLESPDRLRAIETALNASPDSATLDDLQALLLMLKPNAIQPLCLMMANLKHKAHRLMICEVLTTLAKQNPTLLLKGLSDSRWYYVRNLVYVIGKLNAPQLAKHLDPLVTHQDARVRKEVLRTLRTLCPTGTGHQFVIFLTDQEELIRLSALKVLSAGRYTAGFSIWAHVVTAKSFLHRSHSEKRAIFHAMRHTAEEEIIPYCRDSVVQWHWAHRKAYQELAVLAADTLGQLATPAAVAVLQAGAKRLNRAIRKACLNALAAISQSQDGQTL